MKRLLRVPLTLALASCLFLSVTAFRGCGGSSSVLLSLKVALASSTPLVNSLVSAGVIPQDKATKIVTDFTDGTQCALTLDSEFKAIPSDAPDKKVQKLNAATRGMRCWRVIVNRQNFAANQKVQNAANIVDGIFATLVVFYSESGDMVASVDRSTPMPVDEKALEQDLKKQVDELKKAMKP